MVTEFVYSPHYDFFIDRAERDAGYDMRTFHVHKKYEIYYAVEGTRRYYIDDAAYLVNAGNVVLLGPDSIHKTGSVENSSHARYVLNFSREYLQPIADVLPGANLFTCFEMGVHLLTISPKKQAMIESILSHIWETRDDDSPQADALRKTQLCTLLLHLAQFTHHFRQEQNGQERINNKTIDSIQSYISTHYKENLTLTNISAQFYMSPYYVSRLFKKTTNLSLVEYINSVRVMAAKRLLESTNFKVTRVSDEAGFSTTAHFSRVFKESTGLSPQQYRKYYHNTHQDD